MHVVLQMDRHIRVPEVGERWWVLVPEYRRKWLIGRCDDDVCSQLVVPILFYIGFSGCIFIMGG